MNGLRALDDALYLGQLAFGERTQALRRRRVGGIKSSAISSSEQPARCATSTIARRRRTSTV